MKRGLADNQGNDNDNRNQRFKSTNRCWCKDEKLVQEYSNQLENFIRKVVGEETDQAVKRCLPSSSRFPPNQAEHPEPRKFKLHFVGSLLREFFTGNTIETEGPSSSIQVLLLDAQSGHEVNNGPLSSLKVEILVLHGHFKAEQLEHWTKKVFNDNIVPSRYDKGPLLVGECMITLRNGMGLINKICFTDNSSWVPSKMFRLGARAALPKEDIVMEAVSTPFKVKHKRGESYEKHETPSLDDEVWRLHGIAKNGKLCKCLAENQIHKVKDIVQQFHNDENLLRQKLGVSPKKLKAIVEQAISSLSSNIYTNPSELSPNDIPSLYQHQFCVPAPNPDQTKRAMSCNDGTNYHTHQLHESMPINQVQTQVQPTIINNNSLMDNLLDESCNDLHNYALNYPMNPSSPTGPLFGQQDMFNVPGSTWFVGSSSNFQIESLDPLVIGGGSNKAKSKGAGWSKIRAVWRILVTLRKGKFSCHR